VRRSVAWVVAFGSCVVLVLLCMAYVDRPIAAYVETHLSHTKLWDWTTYLLWPLPLVLALVLGFQVVAGCWALAGRVLAPWMRTPLISAWSAVWALAVTVVLKRAFGREDIGQGSIAAHGVEFRWLHGGPGHEAFPSGTMMVAGALLSVVWLGAPRLRTACATLLALLGLALVITNSHWVADLIGGGFLGVVIGRMTVLLLDSAAERLRGGGFR
jgi:PAP2 superfamily